MTTEEIKQVIDTLVHDQLEEIFGDIVEAFEIETGDISPEEESELREIEDKLCKFIMKYLKNNADLI